MSTRPVSTPSGPTKLPDPDAPASDNLVARAKVTDGGLEAEVALGKGHTAIDGLDGTVDVEVFSGSMSLERNQVTVEGAVNHVDVDIEAIRLEVTAEALSFRVNRGTKNADGSVGQNAGIQATLVGVEATQKLGTASSLTLGLSAGAGAEISVGTRDFDKDNNPEFCLRVSLLWGTVGTCIENPF